MFKVYVFLTVLGLVSVSAVMAAYGVADGGWPGAWWLQVVARGFAAEAAAPTPGEIQANFQKVLEARREKALLGGGQGRIDKQVR